MVKDLGWLASAEAESSTARRGLRSQVDELQAGLSTEQKAHQHAVKQYVDALDAKSVLQLQLQDTQKQFDQLTAAHEQLQKQHQHLQGSYNTLVGQCQVVRVPSNQQKFLLVEVLVEFPRLQLALGHSGLFPVLSCMHPWWQGATSATS